MHDAERLIAIARRVDENAEAENIGQLFEADRLAFHLAPDRISALGAADDARLDAAVGEFLGELLFDLGNQLHVTIGKRREPRGDHLIRIRIEFAERQVVEFLAHLMHAHAAGKRRIDFQRLLGGAFARGFRHVVDGAHVVQTVGELDQQHANIVGNRQQKLAQVFRLLGFLGDQIELLELGQAFDQHADVGPEQLIDLGARGRGILDGVMQKRGGDRRVVQLEIGEDRRHFDRMREIRIAGRAPLIAMRLHGVDIGAVEQRLVGVRIVGFDPLDQIVLPHHLRLAGLGCLFGRLRRSGSRALQRGPGRGLLLHAREIGARRHHLKACLECAGLQDAKNCDTAHIPIDITTIRHSRKGLPCCLTKSPRQAW